MQIIFWVMISLFIAAIVTNIINIIREVRGHAMGGPFKIRVTGVPGGPVPSGTLIRAKTGDHYQTLEEVVLDSTGRALVACKRVT